MKKVFPLLMAALFLFADCKSKKATQDSGGTAENTEKEKKRLNKTQKGTAIGAGAGAVVGGVIGSRSKNTALGAILGAAIGGAAGAVIGNKMDKQAKKMEDDLKDHAKVERVGEGIKVTFDSQLLFDFGKADLKEANKIDLRRLSESLKQYSDTELLIIGHTDNVGSDVSNQSLSEKRAASVVSYLSSLGVNFNRLRKEGRGEAQPVAGNDTDAGRTQNRRVEIAIYASDKMKTEATKEAGN